MGPAMSEADEARPGEPGAVEPAPGGGDAPLPAAGPTCSDWARSQELAPVGSAGHYRGYVLVEHPLPWPGEVTKAPGLAEVASLAATAGLRAQAVVAPEWRPRGGEAMPLRRVVLYRGAEQGWATPGARVERQVPAGSVAEALAEMLAEGEGAPGTEGPLVDVLVCTHGSRDRCCGARGMGLLQALGAPAPDGAPQFRLWRTSHTGGHRFAPTVVVLPSGTLWAYADTHLVRRVVAAAPGLAGPRPEASSGPGPDDGELLRHYRGCALLGPPPAQALEGAVAARTGLGLLSARRRALDLGGDLWRLETPEGAWEARVTPGRQVPQPDCQALPATATKWSTEWAVHGLQEAGPLG